MAKRFYNIFIRIWLGTASLFDRITGCVKVSWNLFLQVFLSFSFEFRSCALLVTPFSFFSSLEIEPWIAQLTRASELVAYYKVLVFKTYKK